ncbi:bifunctional hydroxymethylpyrimidine kinase/phosphomethylpyrimidine kinase [Pseudodesulfovibrio sp. F-1]|uniref:hydroxymethylpyrimidine kinase n=1 Tax=Pseudodesulfovibrio alkaliphilus TaxID=2661613 RepID=A0A7K1KQD1_9BACT|nr:bifunctional hydroxymethylpyrimidine kinase/phosphomethylpyrimidine kinase [Pseudodesulfovibrio alkaliphilus]MUM78304.1 bifunctional hydroxymethylpyrimidine kinase/phosphomethylpyrimidine kinase [Pseudodesulfovibrio alkaliphilus]
MTRPPSILTIAGSDSGGGAGIQADLKTIAMLGGYGASVITALTAQNTRAVTGIQAPSAKFVALQLTTVLDDIRIDAAKTGMLFSGPIIKAIAPILAERRFPLVVDPVCVSTSGAKLLKDEGVEALMDLIFPLADLVTPNRPEAELLTGMTIRSRDDVFRAARLLLGMGPKAVLIKGGHADSLAVTDWYVAAGAEPMPFMQQRVDTGCTHGTGCTLSAAIATGVGQGLAMDTAILRAQKYLNLALRSGYPLGQGGGPPNHLAPWLKECARAEILGGLERLGRRLVLMPGLAPLVPRTGANVAVALPHADDDSEVAAFSCGIVRSRRGDLVVAGCPAFGASARTAATLLACSRLRPETGCVMTLALPPRLRATLERFDVPVAWMNREHKPGYVGEDDGRFESWAAFEAMRAHADPASVQAVADPGGFAGEPVVRLLAKDIPSLEAALCRIIERMGTDEDD